MKVHILQISDTCEHVSDRKHFEREPVQGLIQYSQVQDWSQPTTFLGYGEVGAVEPFLPLCQGDRFAISFCRTAVSRTEIKKTRLNLGQRCFPSPTRQFLFVCYLIKALLLSAFESLPHPSTQPDTMVLSVLGFWLYANNEVLTYIKNFQLIKAYF